MTVAFLTKSGIVEKVRLIVWIRPLRCAARVNVVRIDPVMMPYADSLSMLHYAGEAAMQEAPAAAAEEEESGAGGHKRRCIWTEDLQ